jgi:hypothetical protein
MRSWEALHFDAKISHSLLDQEKELKQFREQIREQFKQIKREFDSPYNGNASHTLLLNNTGKALPASRSAFSKRFLRR